MRQLLVYKIIKGEKNIDTIYYSYEELKRQINIIQFFLDLYKKESHILKENILLHEKKLEMLLLEKEKVDNQFSEIEGKEAKIYYYRKIKGLTQEQTAEKMDMSTRQIQRIEKKINQIMAC
ncbi:MAG: helix-turn-helix domain-containing protein [Vallitalea sp.]|nr:helix-turn-helix domain-containing protein [Vallitalea sp.]